MAADDMSFAYIKATEGGDHVDRRFAQNWKRAAVAGVERGAYHFFTLCTPGRAQAEHFLEVVPDDEGALPPAVDLELAGNCAARPPTTTVRRELDEFVAAVESTTGQRVVLYVGDDFENAYPLRKALDRPLWHRRIFWRADVDGWWIWQFTGWGRVDGIRGRVDVNVRNADRDGRAVRRPSAVGSQQLRSPGSRNARRSGPLTRTCESASVLRSSPGGCRPSSR